MKASRFNRFITRVSVAFSLVGPVLAATGTWSATTGGNWENANTVPWTGGIVADGATFTANLTSDILADTTVTLAANRIIGNITLNDTGASGDSRWILAASGGSVLTLDNGGSDAVITKTSNATILAPLANTGTVSITGGGNLTISGTNTGLVGTVKLGGTNQIFIDNNNALGSAAIIVNGQPAFSAITNDVTLTNAVTFNSSNDSLIWTGGGGKVMNLGGPLTLNASNTSSQGFYMYLGDMTQSGNVFLGSRNLAVQGGNLRLTVAGNISDTGGISKSSSGILLLSGTNSYSGPTTINNGTLTLDYTTNNTNKLGTSTVSLGTGVSQRFIGNVSAATSQTVTLGSSIDGGSIFLDTAAGQTLTVSYSGGSLTNRGLYVGSTGSGSAQLQLPGTIANTALLPNVIFNNTFGGTDANNYVSAASGAVNTSTSDLALWATGSTQYVSNAIVYSNSVGTGVTVDGITFDFTAARTVAVGTGNTLGLTRGIIVTPTVGDNLSTIAGGSISAGTSAGPLSIFNTNPSNGLTISSVIADNGGSSLVKYGRGLLTLSATNTYTGGTVVELGTVNITGGSVAFDQANSRALGTGNSVTVNAGATLRNSTDRGVSGGRLTTRTVTLNGSTLDLVNQDYFYQTTMNGATISGGGRYRVGNLVDSGLITTLASATTSTISATVDLTYRNLSLAVADGAAASDLTISSIISQNTGDGSGAKSINKSGAGTLTLSNANTFTGGVNLSGGTIAGSNALALGSGPISVIADSAITTSSSITNNIGIDAGVTLSLRGGFVNVSGIISGDGNIAVPNTIQLTGPNTYTGRTSVSGGFLVINSESSLGATPGTVVADSLTLTSGGNISNYITGTAITLSANRGVTLALGNTGGIDAAGGALTINGVITGDGSLGKTGGATLTLAGTNNYTGGTRLTAGTIQVNNASGLGSGTLAVSGAGNRSLIHNAGAEITNDITIASGTNLSISGGFRTFSGDITGLGSLTATSAIQVSGTNTYSGKTIVNNSGLLCYNTDAALGAVPASFDATNITLSGGGGLSNYIGAGGTLNANRGISLGTGQQRFDAASVMQIDGVISGAGGFYKTGVQKLTLIAANTYLGATSVNAGTLALSGAGSISDSASLTIAAGARLDTTAKTGTYSLAGETIAFGLNATGAGTSGQIDAGALAIGSATVSFNITGALNDPEYLLASYTSLTGTFSVAPPAGYEFDYGTGSNSQIKLVQLGYDFWINSFTFDLGADKTRTGDPDGDGFNNLQEFLFGTAPNAGNGALTTTESSGGTLIIRWNQRLTGATYTLTESATLANPWTTSVAPVTNDGAAVGDYQPRRADVTIGAGSLFFRVDGVENN